MKAPSLITLFLALFLAVSAAAPADGPIRVLFLGHESKHHPSGDYAPILMKEFGRDGIYFDYYTKPDCLNADTLSHYDALMLYANHGHIKLEQLAALTNFIESGHGFLPIHCASACFGNSPQFIALVGGRAVYLSAFSAYDSPADIAWLKTVSERWLEDLQRLNR